MEINDNRGKKIGRLDESMSKDKMVKVHGRPYDGPQLLHRVLPKTLSPSDRAP